MQFATVCEDRVLLLRVVLQGSQGGQQHPKLGEQMFSCIQRSLVSFALRLSPHTRSSGVTSGDLGSSHVGEHSEIDTCSHKLIFLSKTDNNTSKNIDLSS